MKSTISQEQISETAVRLGIPDVPFTHRRIARAFNLVETNKINEVSHEDGIYRVQSQYDPKAIYTVEVNHGKPSCTCPDGKKTVYCKHMIASMLTALEQEQKASKLTIYDDTFDKRNGKRHSKYGRWVVNDYKVRKGYVVYRDEHGKLHCACGKKECRHCKAIREVTDSSKRIENECGTTEAKALQNKLNGNDGTGGESHPSTQLDTNDPFQESEQLDIDQINGNGNGDLVHHLSNGEYIISYNGIMKLAEQHDVKFTKHTVKSDAKRNGTVVAHARLGNNTRASGKPMNGSFITAVELAKRNAARQLLPLPEIKALEHKAKLEAEFDWQKAKSKCLELVPDFTFDILLNDLVKDGKLEQKHTSDYSRKEWLVIFDACKRDAETNGNNNNGGGDNTPSSRYFYKKEGVLFNIYDRDREGTKHFCIKHNVETLQEVQKQVDELNASEPRRLKFDECRAVARDFVRFSWLKDDMLKEGILSGDWTDDDFDKLKEACEIDASLFGKELGHWTIDIQPNANNPWRYDRRYRFWLMPMSRRCFWCAETEGIMPDTCIHWGRYEIKASLCLDCSQKVGKGELDKDRIVQKFDDLYHGNETVPDTEAEFVERCKEAEADVTDDTTDDNSVDDTPTNGDGKRKLQMDKKLNTWLIEADGTKKEISCREICEQFDGNIVMQLRSGIDCGGDISTVELN